MRLSFSNGRLLTFETPEILVGGETVDAIRIFTHWLVWKLLAGMTSSRVFRVKPTYSCG